MVMTLIKNAFFDAVLPGLEGKPFKGKAVTDVGLKGECGHLPAGPH